MNNITIEQCMVVNKAKGLLTNKIYPIPEFRERFIDGLRKHLPPFETQDGIEKNVIQLIFDGQSEECNNIVYFTNIGYVLTNTIYEIACKYNIKECIGLPCPIFTLFSVTEMSIDGKLIVQIML